MIVHLLFDAPFKDSIIYSVPDKLQNKICLYQRVVVNIQNTSKIGLIILIEEKHFIKIEPDKYLLRIIDKTPIINQEQLELAKFVSNRFYSSLGEAIFKMIPSGKVERSNLIDDDVLVLKIYNLYCLNKK